MASSAPIRKPCAKASGAPQAVRNPCTVSRRRRSRRKRARSDRGPASVSLTVMTGFRVIALAIAAVLLSPRASSAQAWPNRPVTIVVPFPAGGTADLFAREIAQALSDELGQPFVVENRAGGSGNPAAAAVARMTPDGSTLLFASQAQAALNKFLYKRLAYDPARDLTTVVLVIESTIALIVRNYAPVKHFDDITS